MQYGQSVSRCIDAARRRVSLALVLLTLVAVGQAEAGYYTMTPIATDDTPIGPGGEGFYNFGPPTINNNGDVAFMAVTNRWFNNPAFGYGYMQGVYVGNGGALTTVADSDTGSGWYSFGTTGAAVPSINSSGQVAFHAITATGAKGIYRATGSSVTTIAETGTSYSFGTLSSFQMATSMNDSGAVAFEAMFNTFSNNGVFKGSGGDPTLVADRNDSALNGLGTPAITSNGTVAFRAYLDAGGEGYFTGPNPATDTLVDTSLPGINAILTQPTAINDAGTLLYNARLTATNNAGLIISQGDSHAVIADAANGPYSSVWGSGPAATPSINNHGDVAFMAGTDAGRSGIYAGPDPLRHAVIEVNDPLFGSTLQSTNLGLTYQAINDAGQIAFRGRLADGSLDFIARADPMGGSLPINPLMPNPGSPAGVFDFDINLTDNGLGVDDPIFIDPDIAIGYDYELTDAGDPLITSVLLPDDIGDGEYELWLWGGSDWILDQMLTGGVEHMFAGGVDRFRILGIEEGAGLDADDPLAFVTGLTFASGNAAIDLTMAPILVPEPSTLALLALAGLALVRRRR